MVFWGLIGVIVQMLTITAHHSCQLGWVNSLQAVKHCHTKLWASKSINRFLVVAAARFLPGLRGVLSVWVPLTRPRLIKIVESLIRTHCFFFSLLLSFFLAAPVFFSSALPFFMQLSLWADRRQSTDTKRGSIETDKAWESNMDRDVSKLLWINVSIEEKWL